MSEERIQKIQLEIEAGNESLDAVKTLMEKGLYRSAISRTYYGLFHYVRALLCSTGLSGNMIK